MTWLSGIGVALRALRVHNARNALNMAGVMIGVAAVIATAAIGRGAQTEIAEQIALLGTNVIIVTPGSHTAAGVRLGSGTRASLTEDDANAIQDELADVQAATATIWDGGQAVFSGSNWSTGYQGVTPEFFEVHGLAMASGRAFDADDVANAAKVVVLGETVVRNLFGDNDPLGQVIRVRRVPMVVVGVLTRKGQTPWGRDRDDTILMPITTFRHRIVGGNHAKVRLVNVITVKVREDAVADVGAEIRTLLRQRHRLQPGQGDDFTVADLREVITAREESARTMTLLLAAVGAVSLLVGGIGIMTMMLASVTERTLEIGLRMAVGARRRDVLYQFLIEAVMIALLGGACGIVLGIGASFAIGYIAGWRTSIDIAAIGLAIGFATAVGIFFGFYPAHKASRLSPLAALRFE